MQPWADEVERLIEDGTLWERAALERCCRRLSADDAESPAASLFHSFSALRMRLEGRPVPESLRRDTEAVVYPGLWKVIEAVRDDLPVGEQLARVRTLNRRLAHLLAAERRLG